MNNEDEIIRRGQEAWQRIKMRREAKTGRLSVAHAAIYVGVSKSTLDHYRTAGQGPRFIKLGRKVVYDTADLDRWLDRNKRNSTSDQPQLRRRRRRSRFGDPVDVRR